MTRQYPMVRDVINVAPEAGTECVACTTPAVKQVRVAWDYMRGNDDCVPVCNRHYKMADAGDGGRFLAHMNTKDKFFGGQS